MSQRKLKKLRRESEMKVDKIEVVGVSYIEILKKNWLFLFILCFGVVAVYANGLTGDFVSDDYATLINNPLIKDFGHAINGFPTVGVVNWLAAVIFGVTPTVYHVLSLSLYLICLPLIYLFLRTVVDENLSKLSLLLFAFHPVHVEAVAWNSGKPYLLLTIFTTLCFLLLKKYLEKEKLIYGVGALISFALAFLADNPRPFSIFPLILIYFLSKPEDKSWKKLKKFWPVLVIGALVFLFIALPYINTRITTVNSGTNASESLFYDPFFQYPTGISKYLQLFWIPVDLTLYHTMFTFPKWLNWAIFLNYFILMGYMLFKNRKIFFGLAFIFVMIFPSMAPIKVSWLVAERYAFWPLLGFTLFMAIILKYIIGRSKVIGFTLLGILVVFYGLRVVLRNIDWSTNHRLWVNTCQVSPNSHNAWNNIGDDYDKLASAAITEEEKIFHYSNSIKGFTQSTIVKPNYADAYHNRANIFFKIGRLDMARESYDVATTFSPWLYQTYLSLTQIDLIEKKYELALNHSSKAYELQPNDPQSAFLVGVVYAESGNLQESKKILNAVLSKYPNYGAARELLNKLISLESGKS